MLGKKEAEDRKWRQGEGAVRPKVGHRVSSSSMGLDRKTMFGIGMGVGRQGGVRFEPSCCD